MKAVWQARVSQTVASYGEHAPTATACCNACRTCVQSNAIGVALAAVIAGSAGIARFARRFVHS